MVNKQKHKKNILRLITAREIRRTPGRFFAIFAIIALSVGFFCGLRITTPVMVHTVDTFYQESQLFDYRLLSSLGWSEKEVENIRAKEEVRAAEGAWQYDVLVEKGESEAEAYRVHSLTENVNTIRVLKGRLPENASECLMDEVNTMGLSVGDTVRFSDENKKDTLEAFRGNEFTITGFVDASLYANFERGTTSIGSGSIRGYIYLPKEAFAEDYYTEIYVKLNDSSEIFSSAYEQEMDDQRDSWEDETQGQADARHDELVEEAEGELSDAKEEFEEKKQEGAEELSDAEQELSDAQQELLDAKKELDDAEKELADAAEEIEKGEREIRDAENELKTAYAELTESADKLKKADADLATNKNKLDAAETELGKSREKLDETGKTLTEAGSALTAAESELAEKEAELEAGIAAGLIDETTAEQTREALAAAGAELEKQRAEYEEGFKAYEAGEAEYAKGYAEYTAGREAYDQGLAEYNQGVEKYNAGVKEYEDGLAKLETAKKELEDGKKEYEDGLAEFEDGKKEYEDGLADYKEGKKEYAEGKRDYDSEIRDAEEKLSDAEQELADFDDADSWLLERNTNIAYACFESDSQIVRQIAAIFPVFFLLVAALVCATTMTRMVEEQRSQIGTLKGLGYAPWEIVRGYMAYAGIAATLGCLIGYVIGIFLFPKVIWTAYQIMYITMPIRYLFSPKLFIGSLIASLLCSLGTAYAVCRGILNESVAELMRPKAPKAGKRIFLEKIPAVWSRLSFMRKVSLRNIFRYKKRFFMMVLGIGGCTALLLTAFAIRDSVMGFAENHFDRIEVSDAELIFRDGEGSTMPDELAEAMESLEADGLPIVRETRDMLFGRTVKSVTLIAPFVTDRLEEFFILKDPEGNALTVPEKGEALLSIGLATRYGIRKGDTLVLRNEDMEECEVRVAAIFENYVYNYIVLSPETLAGKDGTPDANGLFVNFAEGTEPAKEQTKLSSCDCVTSVTLPKETRDRLTTMMDALKYVILVVILSAGALAVVVLFNLTNINIIERMREIATIKVLGFRRHETSDYIFRENLMLTLFGSIAGLGLGILLHRFVMSQIVVDLVYFPRKILPSSYLYAILVTFGFTVLVNILMSGRLDKINMAESLKAVE